VEKLLKTFKSAKKAMEATDEELGKILNQKQLRALKEWRVEN